MQLSNCKPKIKTRNDRIRTLCTLDTYDVNFGDSYCRKGKQNDNRSRNCPYLGSQSKSTTNKKASMQHQKSQFSAYNCSRVREGSLAKKGKRAMSISQSSVNRVKTDYAEFEPNATRNIGASLKKKLVFPLQDSYKFDCWQVVRKIHENSDEQAMQIYQDGNKKEKCLMIKAKNSTIRRDYEKEMKISNQLNLQLKGKERRGFMKVKKIIKERKDWVVITDKYYHPSWDNGQFYMFVTQFKNCQADLIALIKQIAKNIEILSKYSYAHTCISLSSLYFPIGKNMLKFNDNTKIGNLKHLSRIDSKQSFLSMPSLFRSPPEILNFIMFQCREEFDRDYLDEISRVSAGWQVDVWALGVLVLQFLNGGPLSGEGSERHELISLQKELTIRYSYLLINLQPNLKTLLLKMLSPFPQERPHPKQILRLL